MTQSDKQRKQQRLEQTMEVTLKSQSSWSQMQNLERAIERVSSWPEWKRTAFNYRIEESSEEAIMPATDIQCQCTDNND